jgi:hypothetical protein
MTYLSLPLITLTGSTPGASSGESVELEPNLILKNGEAYTVTVQGIATGTIGASTVTQGFIQHFSVRKDSSVSTITGQDTQDQFGDSGASSWTLAASIASGPDRFKVLFTTGSTTANTQVAVDVFVTQNVTPAGYTQTLFKDISDLYYNPSTDLVWVADLEQTSAVIPVIHATARTTAAVVNVPSGAGWGTGGNNGAGGFAADATYVYACPSGSFSNTIVVINQSTFTVVGYLNPTWGSISYYTANQPNRMVAVGGFLYVVAQSTISGRANVLKFNIASAVSSFPTPVTPTAANTDSHLWQGTTSAAFNARSITYNSTSGNLWVGSTNNLGGPVTDTEALFEINTSLTTVSATEYNSANRNPSTYWLTYAFSHVLWSVGGNTASPHITFNSSTAQIFADGSPFVTLPTSPSPYTSNMQAYNTVYDGVDSTILVATPNAPIGFGSPEIVSRYNSSATLVSTIDTGATGTVTAITATTTTGGIWLGLFDQTGNIAHIAVYSHTIGSETQIANITGF